MAQSAWFLISSKSIKLLKPIHRKMTEDKTRMPCLERKDTDGNDKYKQIMATQIQTLYEKSTRSRCWTKNNKGIARRSSDRKKREKLKKKLSWANSLQAIHKDTRAENCIDLEWEKNQRKL